MSITCWMQQIYYWKKVFLNTHFKTKSTVISVATIWSEWLGDVANWATGKWSPIKLRKSEKVSSCDGFFCDICQILKNRWVNCFFIHSLFLHLFHCNIFEGRCEAVLICLKIGLFNFTQCVRYPFFLPIPNDLGL